MTTERYNELKNEFITLMERKDEHPENSGYCGCLAELNTRLSTKKNGGKVANAKQNDTSIRFERDGKIVYIDGESKINGGRVDSLIDGTNKSKYVIYGMYLCNSTTKGKLRLVVPVIIPTELFISKLQEFGALKYMRHKGIIDGIGIQPSNKAWYEWLCDYPMVYDKTLTWHEDDFEGLE